MRLPTCTCTSSHFWTYRIRPIKLTVLNKLTPPSPLFFTVRGGMASAIVIKKLVKLPPRRSKKHKVTYLSSCQACKPALNSAISAVPSRAHCSYSRHDHILTNKRSFDKLRTSKQIGQRERKGAITAITLRPAIIEGCGKTEDRQHPYFRKISQLAPHRALNWENTVYLQFRAFIGMTFKAYLKGYKCQI